MINFSWKEKTWPTLLVVLAFFVLIIFSAFSQNQQKRSVREISEKISGVAGVIFGFADGVANFSGSKLLVLDRDNPGYYGPRLFFRRDSRGTYLVFSGRNDRELTWRIFPPRND